MRIKLISAILAFSMAFSTVAFAETSADKVYDRANNTIVVSGTTDKTGYARLLLLNPGTDITNMTDAQIWAQTVYADEVAISNGSFAFDSFSINPITNGNPTPVGSYVIRVACGNETEVVTVDYASVQQAIDLLLSATDSTTLSSYVSKYNDVYLFDVGTGSKYASFSDEGKTWVLTRICNDATVINLPTAQKAFTTYASLWRVYAEPWASVRDVIDNYATTIGLSVTNYNLLTNDEKDNLANTLSGTILYQNLSAFQAAVDSAATNIINNRNGGTGDSGDEDGGFNVSFGGGGGGGSRPPVKEPEEENKQDEPQQAEINFSDIENHWAKGSIVKLASKGIVNGKGDNKFDPEGNVTRGEAIKMIILTFAEIDDTASSDFSDVSESSWMYPYISTAAKNGIINGYDDGTAGANDIITRQDLCVMILRAARAYGVELATSDTEHSFGDVVEISDYAQDAVTTLWANDIISGFEDNTFGPKLGTTRAQIAKIIAGFLD